MLRSFASLVSRRAVLMSPAVRSAPSAAMMWSRNFSATAARFGEGDSFLAHKLKEELKFEKEEADKEAGDFVNDFKKRGLFKIEDKLGDKEVTLVRTKGNEKISVIFSTDSLPDSADVDESEEGMEPEPVEVTVIVEKTSGGEDHGALQFATAVTEDTFFIESVSYFNSSKLTADETAEGDWQRRGRYGGPVFQDLDEELQDKFHDFLKERGFDEDLAVFITQYVNYKEQNEYTEWLKQVANWVSK
ncbi:Mitochondrial acidic protein mam33 [Irineochytrium annulatum]|nr:Mitochondrial acidic protein mam33 [Irineochytrium annulatum]